MKECVFLLSGGGKPFFFMSRTRPFSSGKKDKFIFLSSRVGKLIPVLSSTRNLDVLISSKNIIKSSYSIFNEKSAIIIPSTAVDSEWAELLT